MKLNRLMQLLKDNARADGPAKIRMDATSDTEIHLYVIDVIDYLGAGAQALIQALAGQADKTVHLHINSPGGDVFEARVQWPRLWWRIPARWWRTLTAYVPARPPTWRWPATRCA